MIECMAALPIILLQCLQERLVVHVHSVLGTVTTIMVLVSNVKQIRPGCNLLQPTRCTYERYCSSTYVSQS